MKKLLSILFITLGLTIGIQAQNKFYCVQFLSTQNPQLLRMEHVNLLGEPIMVEQVIINKITYNRIMLVYNNEIDAKIALDAYLGAGFPYSLICIRTKEQVDKMFLLYEHLNEFISYDKSSRDVK
jgi:hypothetical protein